MPANIKEVFQKFPKNTLQQTNQIPVINYEDIKPNNTEFMPYDNEVYGEYNRKYKPKPIVKKYIAKPSENDIYSMLYDTNKMNEMEKKVEEITCIEIDKHISKCNDCQKKMSTEKIVYIKSNKQEISQEIMELCTFLATGIFIILLLDKLN